MAGLTTSMNTGVSAINAGAYMDGRCVRKHLLSNICCGEKTIWINCLKQL